MSISNRLDPDYARHFVGPDLGPNCLQKLSADDKSPLVGKEFSSVLGPFFQAPSFSCKEQYRYFHGSIPKYL